MYKFFGEPLRIINSKTSNKPIFRFDSKGEFITDDDEIIRRAIGFFDHIKLKAEIVGEKVAKTYTVPPLTITTKDNETIILNKPEEVKEKLKQCKKCNFACDTQGELLQHYKKNHPKE